MAFHSFSFSLYTLLKVQHSDMLWLNNSDRMMYNEVLWKLKFRPEFVRSEISKSANGKSLISLEGRNISEHFPFRLSYFSRRCVISKP